MKNGFTLLELSIVLVIIGLIIGGITAGADLIRSTELKSVISDYNKYKVAVNTFKLKYNAMPGDMDNAGAYWGLANAARAACLTTAGTDTQTCNGNGDGFLDTNGAASSRVESFMFWEHLANAGIISGSYSGMSGADHAGGGHVIAGENVPEGKISGSGWHIHQVPHGYSARYFASWQGNRLIMLHGTNRSGSRPMDPLFTNGEAFNIDSKIDDGAPTDGLFQALFSTGCTDAGAKTDITGTAYLLSNAEIACAAMFIEPF